MAEWLRDWAGGFEVGGSIPASNFCFLHLCNFVFHFGKQITYVGKNSKCRKSYFHLYFLGCTLAKKFRGTQLNGDPRFHPLLFSPTMHFYPLFNFTHYFFTHCIFTH